MKQLRGGARISAVSMGRIAVALAGLVGSSAILISGAAPFAAASGILPPSYPSVSVPPQVMPDCSLSPVDDTSSGCIDSVLHNINYARSLEGLGPLVLPSDYASDSVPVQQLIITDEERNDRGLQEFSGLDPLLNTAAQAAAQTSTDPTPPGGYLVPLGRLHLRPGLHAARGRLRLDVQRRLRRDEPRLYDAVGQRLLGPPKNILGDWTTDGSLNQTATMGDGNTANGQYAEIFANEIDPAGSMIDTGLTGSLPTPATSAPPDVVQVLPASSSNTAAGTPVTIEGNYFGAAPQVFFGGVPASNVQVDWNGQLTADAPADPAGAATDQVVVTVTTSGGSSSSSPTQGVNEFTYAPASAPAVTSVSPNSGPQVPSGNVVIHGSHFNAGVTPIVDFGSVASILVSYSSTQITATIPPAINPGTVHITVTTPAGTSQVSAGDLYAYSGSGPSAAPTITSGNATTFNAGGEGLFNVTTTGTPGASAIGDTAFTGCTPSALPAGFALAYTGGTTATLEGTPVAGDGGTYTVCLVATNGIGAAATQAFTLTVNAPAAPPPPAPPPSSPPATHGYWLVGSDGGIFSFGAAQFHGSTGSLHLQRPIGRDHPDGRPERLLAGGLRRRDLRLRRRRLPWLHPRCRAAPGRFWPAPQPQCADRRHGARPRDGGGYFMVASDGGVFAFGDAKFSGSCPGIGGCQGTAVAVMPDATGNGYWVVTAAGRVYPFGDAVDYGQPGAGGSSITSAVATPNGGGYWVLDSAGSVFAYGNAASLGSPPAGSSGGLNPASAIFDTSDGGGYWVVTAKGKVSSFGDAPNDGDMSSTHLNGSIVAASGS